MYKEILKKMIKNEKETKKKLLKVYRKALDEIRLEIAVAGLEEDEASYQRLMALEMQLQASIESLYNSNLDIITEHGYKQYEDRYYFNMYQVEKELGIKMDFALLDHKEVIRAINMPIGNITLPDRLKYKNKQKLEKAIRETLIQSAVKGSSYGELARDLTKELEIDYKKALTIMRTEGGRLASIGNLDGIEEVEELGIDIDKQWLATLDTRTRDAHAELDGQIADEEGYFEINGYQAEGPHLFGVPELDINCRCDVISVVNGIKPDYRRDGISKSVIEFQDYNSWLEHRL